MTTIYVLLIIALYFGTLYVISRITAKKSDSSTFFIANRNAPWPLVAYGMIGVAISGITFISVPGQVAETQFSYFQLVIGYAIGLLVIAYVLVPIFYHIKAISIYSYLRKRFGHLTHKTGAVFFLIAQTATASFKLFLMAHVLQILIFDPLRMPFEITVLVTLLLIWLYTYRGGIKTVIITDTLQTTFLLLAVVFTIFSISKQLDLSLTSMYQEMETRELTKTFFWSWDSKHNFFKLLLTGMLLTVMTNGLDQSVMQKHLTCRNLKSSQKNIVTLAIILLFVNALFLFLGGSLHLYGEMQGLDMPEQTDSVYPVLAIEHLGLYAGTVFFIGIAAAAYSSADSSLTGLTTSFCVDILNFDVNNSSDRDTLRKGVHFGFTILIYIIILVFKAVHNQSVLQAFIRASGFIYGPLVGLFAIGIFTRRVVPDRYIPAIAIAAPLVCVIFDLYSEQWFGYKFGYDILVFNSLISFIGFYLLSFVKTQKRPGENVTAKSKNEILFSSGKQGGYSL